VSHPRQARPPVQVRKRDGRLVPYDRAKIADAIYRAAQAVGGTDRFLAEQLAGVVETFLTQKALAVPSIEDVQDAVEKVLIETGHAKTAKAYILYREQRARRRAARQEADGPPLVGGDHGAEAAAFAKGPLVEALVRDDGLTAGEAEDVARAVEGRILASGLPRVGGDLLGALVRAEMFTRGRDAKTGRVATAAVPRERVRAALEGALPGRRAASPAEAAAALGEALLAEHVLTEILPGPVAEAHRLGDLHLYDLGAPLSLTAVTLPASRVLQRHLWGEGASRAFGARRAVAALRRAVAVAGPFAARTVALEDVNVLLAPFVARLDDDTLREELRELLLAPELAAFPGRGGLLSLELGLSAEIPRRLRECEVPPPAPPGMRYGDLGDEALRVARLLVREHNALRREGRAVGPVLTLVVTRGGSRDASLRALVREALAAASEVGEPVLVFEHADGPSRGCRWLRLDEADSPDPLRFATGDVTVASATAVNLVAPAARARKGLPDALAEIDRLIGLALDAAVVRRGLLTGPAAEPGGALWRLASSAHPLVDVEGAWHVLEPVGADQAAALLEPHALAEERMALRRRILEHVQKVALEQADARGLGVVLVESPSAEAALRFAALDAGRHPEVGVWWEGEEQTPTYRTLAAGHPGVNREPAWSRRARGSAWRVRVRHRIDGERRPPVDDLLRSYEAAEKDLAVVEYAVDPWPRRVRFDAARDR
jgi:ribonucleoside-triphosphate reductase